jgi:multisubunit Na+/H+ antiporter MnhC subunit
VQTPLGSVIWSGFRRSYGLVATIIGLAVGIGAWVVPVAEQTLTLRVVVGIGVPLCILVFLVGASLVTAAVELHSSLESAQAQLKDAESAVPPLPRALFVTNGTGEMPIVLLEPSELFAHGVGVSFYLRNGHGFEELLGVGKVWNVQQDRKIQAILLAKAIGAEPAIETVLKNEKETLNRLYVKPSVPHDDLMRLQGASSDDDR